MSRLIDVGAVDDLVPGEMKAVVAEGRELLLARVGDEFYAADERCPHMGGRLSRGVLEGTVVTCPRHGSRFDLVDGSVTRWTEWSGLTLRMATLMKSPRSLEVFPVEVQGVRLLVDVDPSPR